MSPKRILFCTMCVILTAVVVLSGVVAFKVGGIVESLRSPNPPSATPAPTPEASGTEPTQTPTDSQPPATKPTEESHTHLFALYRTHHANCLEGGYALYRCDCGASDIRDMTDALGHKETKKVINPTCEEMGYAQYTCSRCGHVDKREYVNALGHSKITNVIAPTCTAGGYTEIACSRCTQAEKKDFTDALGHSLSNWEAVGNDKKIHCTNTDTTGCTLEILASNLKITSNTSQEQANGDIYVEIYIGVDEAARLYKYTIIDKRTPAEREAAPISFDENLSEGLIVKCGDTPLPAPGLQDYAYTFDPTPGYTPSTGA